MSITLLPFPFAISDWENFCFSFYRFWYESPSTFDHSQLVEIRQTTLARVLCDNGDNIDRVQPDAFLRATHPTGYVNCSSIPRMALRMWKDCDEGGVSEVPECSSVACAQQLYTHCTCVLHVGTFLCRHLQNSNVK